MLREEKKSEEWVAEHNIVGVHVKDWSWYLRSSRSVSRRARGDRTPSRQEAWTPDTV